MRLGQALRTFWKVLNDPEFAAKIEQLSLPAPEAPEEPAGRDAARLLAILQRDGRLVDFLSEDVSAYSDAQVGAAARDIHRDCKASLWKYVQLDGVIQGEEDRPTTVPAGFDPAAIRLTGQVKGAPPFRGTLVHRGWRASTIQLPDLPEGADPMLIAPAEVSIP
jgi:hypothetical protein